MAESATVYAVFTHDCGDDPYCETLVAVETDENRADKIIASFEANGTSADKVKMVMGTVYKGGISGLKWAGRY